METATLTVCLWASHMTSLCLDALVYKMRIQVPSPSLLASNKVIYSFSCVRGLAGSSAAGLTCTLSNAAGKSAGRVGSLPPCGRSVSRLLSQACPGGAVFPRSKGPLRPNFGRPRIKDQCCLILLAKASHKANQSQEVGGAKRVYDHSELPALSWSGQSQEAMEGFEKSVAPQGACTLTTPHRPQRMRGGLGAVRMLSLPESCPAKAHTFSPEVPMKPYSQTKAE